MVTMTSHKTFLQEAKKKENDGEVFYSEIVLLERHRFVIEEKQMGCGSGRPYTEKDVRNHIEKTQPRLPSPELIDGSIQLKSTDGFYNSSSLLDSTWLKGKLTNNEYRQAIEHINDRVAQAVIGTSSTIPMNEITKAQTTMLAVQELNAKYSGRAQFTYRENPPESFILINVN